MTLAAWIELVVAVLKFPSAALALLKALEKTPAEKHQDIIDQVNAFIDKNQSGDRPTWEHP